MLFFLCYNKFIIKSWGCFLLTAIFFLFVIAICVLGAYGIRHCRRLSESSAVKSPTAINLSVAFCGLSAATALYFTVIGHKEYLGVDFIGTVLVLFSAGILIMCLLHSLICPDKMLFRVIFSSFSAFLLLLSAYAASVFTEYSDKAGAVLLLIFGGVLSLLLFAVPGADFLRFMKSESFRSALSANVQKRKNAANTRRELSKRRKSLKNR